MLKIFEFADSKSPLLNKSREFLALSGGALVLVAVMIFAFPELVAYFMATALLWLGLFALVLAFRARKAVRRESSHFEYHEVL